MAFFKFLLEGTEDIIFEVERPYKPTEDGIILYAEVKYKVESVEWHVESTPNTNPITGRTKPWGLSTDLYKVYLSVVS